MEFLLTLKRTRDTVRSLIKPAAHLGLGAVRHASPRVECRVENASHETILSGVGIGLTRTGWTNVHPMLSPGGRAKALSVSQRNGHGVAMFRTSGSKARLVGALALLAPSLMVLASPGSARADTIVLQDSNGFFGNGGTETARQKVSISEDKLKVLDSMRGYALYVRLDKKTATETFANEKAFVEKPLSSFAEIRAKREKTRAEKIDEYKKLVEKAKDDSERRNLKRSLEAMGLREDGKTVARFESFPADNKNITLVVNNVKQQVAVTHHKVRENEGREVFDIWVAASIEAPANMLRFYKELGTFSPEVVGELEKNLKGFPVEITAILDDGNNQKTLHSTVHEIRQENVPAADYDVPAGFKAANNAPAPANAGNAAKTTCAVCGKECAPGTGEASYFVEPWTQKRYPVCGEEHRREIIRKLAADQRPKQAPANSERPK